MSNAQCHLIIKEHSIVTSLYLKWLQTTTHHFIVVIPEYYMEFNTYCLPRKGLLYTKQKATSPRSALALFAKPDVDRGVK